MGLCNPKEKDFCTLFHEDLLRKKLDSVSLSVSEASLGAGEI